MVKKATVKVKTFACMGTTLKVRAKTKAAAQKRFAAYLVGDVVQVPPKPKDQNWSITQKMVMNRQKTGRKWIRELKKKRGMK